MAYWEGEGRRSRLRETEFLRLLEQVLPQLLDIEDLSVEPRLGENARPDFVARMSDGSIAIIEAKAVTPNTSSRLLASADQLLRYAQAMRQRGRGDEDPRLILAVPGVLSPHLAKALRDFGIDLLDGAQLSRALVEAGIPVDLDAFARPAESQAPDVRGPAEELQARLDQVAPGRSMWSEYQRLCGDVLTFLFCPPLERPIGESANESRINRRDFVLPNYASEGFWAFLRTGYGADYIVVDSKNYLAKIKKSEVLQLANYLNRHGTGLFGLIIARGASDRSAELTRREQWILHQKLILTLNDDDLRQMLAMKQASGDPADLVRQKIEDFRLGF